MVTKKKGGKKYSADRLMLNVASTLVRDFQEVLNDVTFESGYLTAILSGRPERIRKHETSLDMASTWRFKASYQIQSLLKRYRFRKDIYSDDELTKKAVDSFLATQHRVAPLDFSSSSGNLQKILDTAAYYIADVLGNYSDEEHRASCRFGRKASVGIPARLACEAARWVIPISGSSTQISWFNSEMSSYPEVMEYLSSQLDSDPQGSIYQPTESLALTLVPKTFKSLRTIMPNTTIGSYMSYGLGEMIRKRLKGAGYDIRKLQLEHRKIARLASSHEMYVTADLSSASDSITDALVKRLMPDDWYQILVQSRIGNVTLPDGSIIQSSTFCTMGIGYTFPLQTLIFLSLLIAIQATMFHRTEWGKISVYGDDLIYHRQIHDLVLHYFPQLGFVLNVDKTFSDGGFRESCGGDYYRGVDVRPFQPRNGQAEVGSTAYEAMLYKYINGLLMRWSEHEIRNTLSYLHSEVVKVTGVPKLVPLDYPDDSGIKCSYPNVFDFLRQTVYAKPKHVGHGIYRFSFLRLTPKVREEKRHVPYFWLALSSPDPIHDYSNCGMCQAIGRDPSVLEFFERLTGVSEVGTPQLLWKVSADQTVRSKLTGRRLRRLVSYVTVSHTGTYKRQSGTSGFEDRR